MDQLLYILVATVNAFITVMTFLLLVRAILSLFASEESRLLIFAFVVTEPIIYPIRLLLSHIPALEDLPIDISFMVTYIILILVQSALPVAF